MAIFYGRHGLVWWDEDRRASTNETPLYIALGAVSACTLWCAL